MDKKQFFAHVFKEIIPSVDYERLTANPSKELIFSTFSQLVKKFQITDFDPNRNYSLQEIFRFVNAILANLNKIQLHYIEMIVPNQVTVQAYQQLAMALYLMQNDSKSEDSGLQCLIAVNAKINEITTLTKAVNNAKTNSIQHEIQNQKLKDQIELTQHKLLQCEAVAHDAHQSLLERKNELQMLQEQNDALLSKIEYTAARGATVDNQYAEVAAQHKILASHEKNTAEVESITEQIKQLEMQQSEMACNAPASNQNIDSGLLDMLVEIDKKVEQYIDSRMKLEADRPVEINYQEQINNVQGTIDALQVQTLDESKSVSQGKGELAQLRDSIASYTTMRDTTIAHQNAVFGELTRDAAQIKEIQQEMQNMFNAAKQINDQYESNIEVHLENLHKVAKF